MCFGLGQKYKWENDALFEESHYFSPNFKWRPRKQESERWRKWLFKPIKKLFNPSSKNSHIPFKLWIPQKTVVAYSGPIHVLLSAWNVLHSSLSLKNSSLRITVFGCLGQVSFFMVPKTTFMKNMTFFIAPLNLLVSHHAIPWKESNTWHKLVLSNY